MRAIVSLSLMALLAATPALADCTAPVADIEIPDGSTATRDAMIAAQRAVKEYDKAVKTYGDCLMHEVVSKVAEGGDQLKLRAEYDKMNNVEVDKLQKLADKFNQELRAFKARNAG